MRDKEDETSLTVKDPTTRKKYNGLCVGNTSALQIVYKERIEEAGLRDFYRLHYRKLGQACLRLSLAGFRVDHEARRHIVKREDAIIEPLKTAITTMCGDLFGPKGGFSVPKVASYFYGTLGCKPFIKRGTGKPTCDELAIRKLKRRYKKARPAADLILSYREHKKIRQEVRAILVDDDGRMRSRFSPTTATGRLRAKKTPTGSGVNLQNRDRHSDLRTMFVPDKDHLLIELDLSQAEDRIVDGKSGDPEALRTVGSTAIDRHVLNASKIFKIPYDELLRRYKAGDPDANEKRQFGKKTRHSVNYDQSGVGMADSALVESEGALVLDPDEAQEWIDALKEDLPGIPVFHAWVGDEMLEKGYLEDSWGWRIYFKGLRLSHDDRKAGYAWHGSDEVAKLMNQLGFVVADEMIYKTGAWEGAKVVQQGHDSVVITTPLRLAWPITTTLVESLSQQRTYPGARGSWKFRMPVGIKVMKNWRHGFEWKQLPSREAFMAEARRMMG
jgi:DNA polymerase I-like protein with 3'-5' exonuclease and polymerase domains